MTGPWYCGSILTAVCVRDVVAPPMSSGSSKPFALHLARDVAHLLERRRDEPGQPDEVGVRLARRLEDPLDRDHDAEVDDLVVVAGQDDAHDVLADVVDVALDRGHDDPAVGPRRAGLALGLDERHEVGDRLLHHPGALDHLGQEHLAGPEQVADDVHPVHQRPLDDLDRAGRGLARLLGVLDDERVDTLDQGVGQPLVDRQLAPGERVAAWTDRVRPLPGVPIGDGEQPFRRVRPAVQHDVLDELAQRRLDVVVDRERARR